MDLFSVRAFKGAPEGRFVGNYYLMDIVKRIA